MQEEQLSNHNKVMEKLGYKNYIWYCPTKECRNNAVILMKTVQPFLGEGDIKCEKCQQVHSFHGIMRANKKNIQSFLTGLN